MSKSKKIKFWKNWHQNVTWCLFSYQFGKCDKTNLSGDLGGSPGLVVMGRNSHSKGHGFESRHRILDGHFFTYICCKNCNVCLKRPKINEKEAGVGPFKKKLVC